MVSHAVPSPQASTCALLFCVPHLSDAADAFDNQPWLCTSPDSPYTDSVVLPWKEYSGPVQTGGQSNTITSL